MKIRYKGLAGIRIIDPKEFFEFHEYAPEGVIEDKPYIWDVSNGFVQDVKEQELVEELLTYPTNEFEIAAEEYLAKLAEAGILVDEVVISEPANPKGKRGKKSGLSGEKEMPADGIDEREGG